MTNTVAHLEADACEVAMVSLIADELEKRNVSTDGISESRKKDLIDHLNEYPKLRGIVGLSETDYYKNCVKWTPKFVSELIDTFPNSTFNVFDVEKEYRDMNMKGDYAIVVDGKETISFSLKNYKGGVKRPQVCSGTYNSFVMNILFKSDGVGMFTNPIDGSRFNGKGKDRDLMVEKNYGMDIVKILHKLDKLNVDMKEDFANSPDRKFFDKTMWETSCHDIGHEGADMVLDFLKNYVPKNLVRNRVMKMAGVDGAEELLAFDGKNYLNSLVNKRFKRMLETIPTCELNYFRHAKNIRFEFKSGDEIILEIDIPFTLNSNGCWYKGDTVKDIYEGKRFHEKEGIELEWGERRPKKSREIATSVNTYVDFAKDGLFI
jgi:hypothetical protein